ncbi:MAG: glucose 1-dehydrogenase [Alphaproteobacteria bacterium]|nr:glucose 1-dehydrogenase [Alphaproteobacteria bacterium]
MNRLDGKVALVTGGARGLGGATAKLMAAAGAKVLITDLLDEVGAATVAGIEKAGGKAAYLHHDVVDEAGWEKAVKFAADTFGGLDILVNNAGIASDGKTLEETTLESWRRVIAVDLDSLFLGIKHAIPLLRARAGQWPGGGSIINISSIMGFVGMPGAASYIAAKGGVRLLTKAAALELAPSKIRVNSVHPGFTETDMVKGALKDLGARSGGVGENVMKDMITQRHPIGRMGVPIDIANAVCFLASDDSAFMTGSEVVVDGGYIAQ